MKERTTPRRPRPSSWLPGAAVLLALSAIVPVEALTPAAAPSAWVELAAPAAARPGPAAILGLGLAAVGPCWDLCAAGLGLISDPAPPDPACAEHPAAAAVGGTQGWYALEMEWNVSGNPDPPPEGSEPH